MGVHFWLGSKNAQKKQAVKKWPDAFLRSPEISQTPPKAFGVKHEKFQPFCFGERPATSSRPEDHSSLLGGIWQEGPHPAINLTKSQDCWDRSERCSPLRDDR
jgi:hypothetical protein